MTTNGLYVHLPFCGAICHYCDFVKFIYQKKWVKPYLKGLQSDLTFFKVAENNHTVYVGGGTPTALSLPELRDFLYILSPYTKEATEYTFEANIESVTPSKLNLLRKYGVNRLSIGVQSTNDKRLIALNRQHTYAQIKRKIRAVKKAGFTNFSVDLIYGLPEQSIEELKVDIANILKLRPPHISTYALTIEPNTVAFIKKWPRVSNDESRLMYDLILNSLRAAGYVRYEVSNFALPGYESVHNKRYWRNEEYSAVGLGASGYRNGVRYVIKGGLTRYLRGERQIEEETITRAMFIEEYLMLYLRLASGFPLTDFKSRTGKDFLRDYAQPFATLVKNGLLTKTTTHVMATDEGMMLLDSVVLTLISE